MTILGDVKSAMAIPSGVMPRIRQDAKLPFLAGYVVATISEGEDATNPCNNNELGGDITHADTYAAQRRGVI